MATKLKKNEIFENLPVRNHKAYATRFGIWLYLMGLYQVSPNSPGVKFDPTPGVTSLTWDYIGKPLEFFLYVAMRPRGYQILHVALSSGPLSRLPKL